MCPKETTRIVDRAMLSCDEGLKKLGGVILKKRSKHKLRITIVWKRTVRGKGRLPVLCNPQLRPQNDGNKLQGTDSASV